MVSLEDELSGQDVSLSPLLSSLSTSPLSDVCEFVDDFQTTAGVNHSQIEWFEFKIVGDNLDKNVRPSFQSFDWQTKSFHHFHSFAVRDRIDFSSASTVMPSNMHLPLQHFFLNLASRSIDIPSLIA